jgi:REP element-mobilizing transposase RayT
MNIGRKHLPHDGGPLSAANPEGEVYFITICCLPRGQNQLAHPDIWQAIDDALTHRDASGVMACRLALAMPDHFHALMEFRSPMKPVVSAFKSWLARQQGIRWQRDFFDHRLRGWEKHRRHVGVLDRSEATCPKGVSRLVEPANQSATEKAQYIRMNPVRAGLVANPQDWPYQR